MNVNIVVKEGWTLMSLVQVTFVTCPVTYQDGLWLERHASVGLQAFPGVWSPILSSALD